jgi:hypothetical protein
MPVSIQEKLAETRRTYYEDLRDEIIRRDDLTLQEIAASRKISMQVIRNVMREFGLKRKTGPRPEPQATLSDSIEVL